MTDTAISQMPDDCDQVLPQIRRLVTPIPGPRSLALAKRQAAAVVHSIAPTMPVYAAAASGAVVVDVDGNSLIDLGSGIGTTSVGNAAPAVVEAAQQQLAAFTHTCFMTTPYELYIAVAERLAALYPRPAADAEQQPDQEYRALLMSSGSEAVENAIKIVRQATGRPGIVVLQNGFHGRTNLTLAMTGRARPYREGFGPFTPEIYRLPGSYPYRDQLAGPQAAAQLINLIEDQVGVGNLAAVLLEPIQGEGGVIVPAPGFVPTLAAWCKANQVALIADEVQCGMARSGHLWAIEHEGVVPDLLVTAKALAGGLPLAAVVGRSELMDCAAVGALGTTYGGNPAAAAACLATFDLIERNQLAERAAVIQQIVCQFLEDLAQTNRCLGQVRGRGAMIGVEVVHAGSKLPDPQTTTRWATAIRQAGVIVLNCGSHRNVLRLLPPLVIDERLLREGLAVIAQALAEVTA
ncbi:MAG: aminotransferase class III-fold pyridoxal phosphate-dependent enzyme [Bifidobacteriaceae bacterium]|jgi:4-aminobutyrate aminotransferase/(S)-3-amino-2-methylpropionate transaminase|nr:aminotransferase class III-fold pyridoxal phosphate-dependent enzyme [Bifidobacteriaceae bacterium]